MTGRTIARRYAKALVGLAQEQGLLERAGAELKALSELLGASSDLRALLYNPGIRRDFKQRVLGALMERLGACALTKGFLYLVLDKGRIRYLEAVAECYQELADERLGRARAAVRTARALTPEATQRLKARLSEISGKEVVLDIKEEPGLIGGLVAQMGSTVMDGSVKSHLAALKDLLARA